MRPAKFLLIRGGAIGDFIVTLPVLQALRQRWPDGHIEIIGYPHVARLALHAGLADRIRSLDEARMARFFAENVVIDDEEQTYLASFDAVLLYLHDPEYIFYNNLKRCGVRVVIATTPIVTDRHATDHFLAPLASLAIYDADAVPQLNVQLKNAAQIPPLPPPAVALHPGSGSRKKNWPLENFLRLADLLAEKTHLQPVWITAEAEQEYIPHLDDQLTDRRRLHALPLEQLAAALATCALFIGNDGGISHLAAATGCPTVTLFGPSPAPLWQPRGRKVLTIQSPDDRMASLTTDEVWRTLQTWLKSLPTSLSMDT